MSFYQNLFGKEKSKESDGEVVILEKPNLVRSDEGCECHKIHPDKCKFEYISDRPGYYDANKQHKCVCHTIGPLFCRYEMRSSEYKEDPESKLEQNYEEHYCICTDTPQLTSYCKASVHECQCHHAFDIDILKEVYGAVCRAIDDDHKCICYNGPDKDSSLNQLNCKYHVHTPDEIKEKEIENPNTSHDCICVHRVEINCKSEFHDIECQCLLVGSNNCISSSHFHKCICDDEFSDEDSSGCKYDGDHNCRCEINPNECLIEDSPSCHKCLCYQRTGPDRCRRCTHIEMYSMYREIRLMFCPLTNEETTVRMEEIAPDCIAPSSESEEDETKKDA